MTTKTAKTVKTAIQKDKLALAKEIARIFAGEVHRPRLLRALGKIEDAEFVRDLAAYIRVAETKQTPKIQIQFNIAHDLTGFGGKCFVPRTRGCAAREQESR